MDGFLAVQQSWTSSLHLNDQPGRLAALPGGRVVVARSAMDTVVLFEEGARGECRTCDAQCWHSQVVSDLPIK
jgi:hypothetical protein